MTQLNPFSIQRLLRLPRTTSVWEGDRQPIEPALAAKVRDSHDSPMANPHAIFWINGSEREVRHLSIVPADSGPEAVVRSLLKGMKDPQVGCEPARPQKIVVRDRELQFYLRGALQDLDITVAYEPHLPMVDELLAALNQEIAEVDIDLPEPYGEMLMDQAMRLWEVAPWHSLNEQQILAVDVQAWGVERLYGSVLGMAGVEYGLLLYRSLDSLRQFRERVLDQQDKSIEQMQAAFLEQDCLFVNFNLLDGPMLDGPMLDSRFQTLGLGRAPEAVEPEFGSIHPLEGMRYALEPEECATLLVALEAICRFCSRHRDRLEQPPFPQLQRNYRIPNPEQGNALRTRRQMGVSVSTLPEVTAELMAQTDAVLDGSPSVPQALPRILDDYVPAGALIMMSQFPAAWLEELKGNLGAGYYSQGLPLDGNLSTLTIQTSRPKAKTMVQQLVTAGGVCGVCFNPGSDPFSGTEFQLGLLKTGDGNLHLFAEYDLNNATDRRTLARWASATGTACAVVVAGGSTGSARGNPRPQDIVAVFEAQVHSPEELQLPPVVLQYLSDWD